MISTAQLSSTTDANGCDVVWHSNNHSSTYRAGRLILAESTVGTLAVVVPWWQPNLLDYSPWHDIVMKMEDRSSTNLQWVSGMASLADCRVQPNLRVRRLQTNGNVQLQRYIATRDIVPGEQFSVTCGGDEDEEDYGKDPLLDSFNIDDAVCVDTIQIDTTPTKTTTTPLSIRATAKMAVGQGETLTTSPMLPLDMSQTDRVQQTVLASQQITFDNTHVIGTQPILPYTFGHAGSNLLLLPLDPGVHGIQQASPNNANVGLQWRSSLSDVHLNMSLMELLEDSQHMNILMADFVALRDIEVGDELTMDYGTQATVEGMNSRMVPPGFYPDHWMRIDSRPHGDFQATPLSPGEISPIRWSSTGNVATPWAFRVGHATTLRSTLLRYCDRMGITDALQHVTVRGNPLRPGQQRYLGLPGAGAWYLQRPAPQWRSNLQWLSPGDATAHEHYLQALSVAGFDEILAAVGEHFGMEGLVVFHVTFIAVSYSNKGYLHQDVTETGGKSFNIIIPLLLADETGPELDIQDANEDKVGRYRYEYDVAVALGDDAYHGTSAVDYRWDKKMRLAATVYVADVNDENAETILDHYTQAYPPRDLELLKNWTASHWKRDDPSRRLPKPTEDHILNRREDGKETGDEL